MPNKEPLISIITVVYNCVQTLEQTILSVINQTYKNIEYIIIDGNSNDGTIDIIKKYEAKISCWISEPDKGIYDAMNKGIALAKGEWILFMNAGDLFFNDDVISCISLKLHDCDVLYGKTQIKENGVLKNIQDPVKITDINEHIPYCHQSVLNKTSFLKKNLFSLKYKMASDFNQYIKIKNQKAVFKEVSNVISIYDIGGFSTKNTTGLLKEYQQILIENTNGFVKKFHVYIRFELYIINIIVERNKYLSLFKKRLKKLLNKESLIFEKK